MSSDLGDGHAVSVRFDVFEADGDNLLSLGFVNVDLDPDDAPLILRLPSSESKFTLLARLEPRGDVEPPAGARHLHVSISNIKILRDQDAGGAGEVRFWALAAGQPTRVTEERKVRGARNPEVDPELGVELFLPPGDDLRLRVIGWDVDPSQRDWMGEITTVVGPRAIDAGDPLVLTSLTGDFEATIEILDLDAPDDTDPDPDTTIPPDVETVRRLVVLESLTVQRDGDDVGPGDLRITATLDRAAGDDDDITLTDEVPIETASRVLLPLVADVWRTELDVPVDGRLTVTASVVDVDVTLDDPMTPHSEASETEHLLGEATLTFDAGDDHGLGAHMLESEDGDVTFRLRILDPADRQGDVQAVVRFEEVEILRDHTTVGRASLWCTASVKGFPVVQGVEFKAGNGDTIVLEDAIWTVPIGVDDGEALELAFEVFEARIPGTSASEPSRSTARCPGPAAGARCHRTRATSFSTTASGIPLRRAPTSCR